MQLKFIACWNIYLEVVQFTKLRHRHDFVISSPDTNTKVAGFEHETHRHYWHLLNNVFKFLRNNRQWNGLLIWHKHGFESEDDIYVNVM